MTRAPTFQTWRPASLQRSVVVDTRFFARNSLLKNKRELQLHKRAAKLKGRVFRDLPKDTEARGFFRKMSGETTHAGPALADLET